MFDNTDARLFPNQFVNTRVLVTTLRGTRSRVPSSAIQRDGEKAFVYALDREARASSCQVARGCERRRAHPGAGDRGGRAGREQQLREAARGRAGPDRGRRARRAVGERDVSPSRLFILRPVATSLLMVAILLVGIVAYRQLPVSALPQVDYPTIQVMTFYPGASPEVMATSVTAPLERQFGQMPGLSQMTSTSSGGASVITLQFDARRSTSTSPSRTCRRRSTRRNAAAAGSADAADLQQGQPGRCADPHARGDVDDDAAARRCRTWSTRASRRRSRSCPASAW